MRVVFDSNVYISALAIRGGVADHAVQLAIEGAFELALSRPILDEVLGILARKFARDAEELARVAIFLSSLAEPVAPTERVVVLAEAPDNRILECALTARADVIVTGDREILSLGTWRAIEILSLRQFVERLGREVGEPAAAYHASELSSHEIAFLAKVAGRSGKPSARRLRSFGLRPV
jgi:putative PIN family toxin of toxin-antitoxin system